MAEVLPAGDSEPGTRWSHALADVSSVGLQFIRGSARMQYTSLAVSPLYLALGTSSGAIQVFGRDTARCLLLLPSEKEGAISQISLSPDSQYMAYGTSTGVVVVTELNLTKKGDKPQRVRQTNDHKGATLSALVWGGGSGRVYAGDDRGRVTAVYVTAKGLFSRNSEVILSMKSEIIQIDVFDERVVASSLQETRIANTERQECKPVGKKPRDGYYGACFYPVISMATPLIYCARPGSRLWEVDYNGTVLSTHQFKHLLDIPELPVVCLHQKDEEYQGTLQEKPGSQAVAFSQLHVLGSGFLLAVSGSHLYVLDPGAVKVVLWTHYQQDILQLRCIDSSVYILTADRSVRHLELLPLPRLLEKSFAESSKLMCASILHALRDSLVPNDDPSINVKVLKKVLKKLLQSMEDSSDRESKFLPDVQYLLGKLECIASVKDTAMEPVMRKIEFSKTDTGIYMSRQVPLSSSEESRTPSDYIFERVKGQSEMAEPSKWNPSDRGNVLDRRRSSNASTERGSSLSRTSSIGSIDKQLSVPHSGSELSMDMVLKIPRTESTASIESASIVSSSLTKDGTVLHSSERRNSGVSRESVKVENEYIERVYTQSGSFRIFKDDSCEGVISDETFDVDTVPKVSAEFTKPTDTQCDAYFEGAQNNSHESHEEILPCDEFPTKYDKLTLKKSESVSLSDYSIQEEGSETESITSDLCILNILGRVQEDTPSDSRSFQSDDSISCDRESLNSKADSNANDVKVKQLITTKSQGKRKKSKAKTPNIDEIHPQRPPSIDDPYYEDVTGTGTRGATSQSVSGGTTTKESPIFDLVKLNAAGNPSPKETILAVKDRVTSTAKSLVQTIKEQGSRLTRREGSSATLELFNSDDEDGGKTREVESGEGQELDPSPDSKEPPPDVYVQAVSSILEGLRDATTSASAQLLDPEVVNDPSKSHRVLESWLSVLRVTIGDVFDEHPMTKDDILQVAPTNDKVEKPVGIRNKHESEVSTDGKLFSEIAGMTDNQNSLVSPGDSSTMSETKKKKRSASSPQMHPQPYSMIPDLLRGIKHDPVTDESTITQVDTSSKTSCHSKFEKMKKAMVPHEKLPTLPSDLKSPVSDLLIQCLQLGIYGNPPLSDSKDVSSATPPRPSQEYESGMLLMLMQQFLPYMAIGRVFEMIKVLQDSVRQKLFWSSLMDFLLEECKKDSSIASLIASDNIDQVLDGLQADWVPDEYQQMALLACKFEGSTEQVLNYCARASSEVPPYHVFCMCAEVEGSEIKVKRQLWLRFVEEYIAERAYLGVSRSDLLHDVCWNDEAYWLTLESILWEGSKHDQLKCSCGYPLPGAHLYNWPRHNLLNCLLTWPTHQPDQLEHLSQLLFETGHWIGYLRKLNVSNMLDFSEEKAETIMKFVMQLDDKRLLDPNCLHGFQPRSPTEWESLLKVKRKLHNSKAGPVNCLNCGSLISSCSNEKHLPSSVVEMQESEEGNQSPECDISSQSDNSSANQSGAMSLSCDTNSQSTMPGLANSQSASNCDISSQNPEELDHNVGNEDNSWTITWEFLVNFMLRNLGAECTVSILASLGNFEESLPSEFYEMCFKYKLAEKTHGLLLPSALQSINSDLWSGPSQVMPPELMKAITLEAMEMSEHNQLSTNTEQLYSKLDLNTCPKSGQLSHHRGIAVDCSSANCAVCGLGLLEGQSLSDSGINILACGHGFHSYCLQNINSCTLCTFAKKQTIK